MSYDTVVSSLAQESFHRFDCFRVIDRAHQLLTRV